MDEEELVVAVVVDEDVVVSEWVELEGEAESDCPAWFVMDEDEFDGEVCGEEEDRLLVWLAVSTVDA